MRVEYSKPLLEADVEKINSIAKACGILFDTARLLYYRNINTPEKAKQFLYPNKSGFYSPFKFNEMPLAVNRIKQARDNGEKVLIFGDYDADGVCASATLYYCLKEYGIIADTVIPERNDGYGLNVEMIKMRYLDNLPDLIITVDCGISDYEVIENIKAAGIDVIVTDHHEPPEILPNTIKINPKIEDSGYPFNCLCGAGVAYKLGYALIGDKADEYLDFVALATVADSMDLIDENRCLVAEGLKLMQLNNIRKNFCALIGDNNGRAVTAQTLAYGLAPKINAGGRMGDARSALDLFLTSDENEIARISEVLKNYNISRQQMCDEIYRQAKLKIAEENLSADEIITVADDNWQAGAVGIVASKLVEEYARPVIVFAGHDGKYKGSARSLEGINVFEIISKAKDLLVTFGGHSQAAGVSVEIENFIPLRERLKEITRETIPQGDAERKVCAEWNIDSKISIRFAKEIDLLEPFGAGNRRPCFTIKAGSVNSIPLKTGSPHYTFKTEHLEMMDWNGESRVSALFNPINKKIVCELSLSQFRGVEYVKGIVKSVVFDNESLSASKLYIYANELRKVAQNADSVRVLPAMNKDFYADPDKTVYCISNPENIKHYPRLTSAKVHVYEVCDAGALNVIVSPVNVPDWATTVVYVDVPLSYIKTNAKSVCKFDYNGFNFIDTLSVDREIFKEYFGKVIANIGKEFKNSVDFYNTNIKTPIDTEEQALQFLFCLEVFMELGFFYVAGGILKRDSRVQKPLDSSLIYKRIFDLKE